MRELSLSPSEYWARQCHIGASFLRPSEAKLRHQVGVDRLMWGTDYPHLEATSPFTREALRATFHDVPEAEVRKILGTNAAELYGFDLEALAPIVAQIGPTVEELATPLDKVPEGGLKCPAFDDWRAARASAVERSVSGLLDRLARESHRLSVPAGTKVVTEGEPGDRFYVVADGTVEVLMGGEPVRRLQGGAWFGELALLHDVPRTATVVAVEDVVLWAVRREEFLGVVAGVVPAVDVAEQYATARYRQAG